MRNRLTRYIASLSLLIVIALSSGCASYVSNKGTPKHRTRNIWINNVYYEQVYYIDSNNNTVVVSQKEKPNKKAKKSDKYNNKGQKLNQ